MQHSGEFRDTVLGPAQLLLDGSQRPVLVAQHAIPVAQGPVDVAGHPRQRGAGGGRARPQLAAPTAVAQHPAGGAVRLPPGLFPATAGLRPDPRRPVGVLPTAGRRPAAAPAGGGLVDVRRPRQSRDRRVPAHPRGGPAPCRPGGPLDAVEGPPRLRRRRLETAPAPRTRGRGLPHAIPRVPLPAGPAQLLVPHRPPPAGRLRPPRPPQRAPGRTAASRRAGPRRPRSL